MQVFDQSTDTTAVSLPLEQLAKLKETYGSCFKISATIAFFLSQDFDKPLNPLGFLSSK